MVEIFLPEIDCDANNGVTLHLRFWQGVYTTRIRGGIIGDVLRLDCVSFYQEFHPGTLLGG